MKMIGLIIKSNDSASQAVMRTNRITLLKHGNSAVKQTQSVGSNLIVTDKNASSGFLRNDSTSLAVMRVSNIVSLRDDNPVVETDPVCWK